MFKKLWCDEGGVIISAELVLVMTILVIGMVVGLVALRNCTVEKLADVGDAIDSVNQSYVYPGCWLPNTDARTAGSYYQDCDTGGRRVEDEDYQGLQFVQ